MRLPDQELYDAAYGVFLDAGINTHDVLPDAKAVMPFVYFGQSELSMIATKTHPLSEVALTVHVFGTRTQRRKVADLTGRLFSLLAKIKRTPNYAVTFEPDHTINTVEEDPQDNGIFWHGLIDVTYQTK